MKNKFVYSFLIVLFLATNCGSFADVFSGQTKTAPKASKPPSEEVAVESGSSTNSSGVRDPIVTKQGVYYFVKSGDTLGQIAQQYKINREDLAQINNLFDSDLVVGKRLFIPHKKYRHQYLSVTKIIKEKKLARDRSNKKVEFIWPMKTFVFTSPFGMRHGRPHDGIDLSAKIGTPIYAVADGKVIFAKRFSGYGKLLVLKHGKDLFSAYAHCTKFTVSLGKTVKQGQQIATVGVTGRVTGPHLHFEIHDGAKAVDPVKYLPKKNYKKK